MPKVVICTPSISGPTAPYIKALEASAPLLSTAGWETGYSQEIGNPYISAARAMMTRKALDANADVVVYLDYDLSWDPRDLLTLIETQGNVVAGTYRFKKDVEQYMGALETNDDGTPIVRKDGCLKSAYVPAGFLKVTREALVIFAKSYPDLLYGDPFRYEIDLFNHGARGGIWWGEDYSFSDRWTKCGGEIWTPPNINLNHHSFSKPLIGPGIAKEIVYKGNLHEFLLRQPGGSKEHLWTRY